MCHEKTPDPFSPLSVSRSLRGADEMWVCTDDMSEGMAGEIAEARRLGVPVYRIDVGSLLSRVGRRCMGSGPMGCAYRLPPPR